MAVFSANCFLKRHKINYATENEENVSFSFIEGWLDLTKLIVLTGIKQTKHGAYKIAREWEFKLSSHVLDRIFLRIPCGSGIQTGSCIHRSGSPAMECSVRSFRHSNQAYTCTRSVSCSNLAGDRNSAYIMEHHRYLLANLRFLNNTYEVIFSSKILPGKHFKSPFSSHL